MPRKQSSPPARNEQVIALYQEEDEQGRKLHTMADITQITGVPRSTIYFILDKYGITTDRQAARSSDSVSAAELLTRLQDVTRENGVLRDKVEKLEAQVEWLTAFTAPVRNGASAPARPRVTRRGAD